MTKSEILRKKAAIEQDELYKKSCSLYKKHQYESFSESGSLLNGVHLRVMKINEHDEKIFFRFTNGLLDGTPEQPAIEYKGHMEYWSKGTIDRIVDTNNNVLELWNNGYPTHIGAYK